ncbi:MAG: preprotein translocase subunit SecE [Clostridia bacterium]|nr:preprotein translocase subunit SecE [Clostridia bacterium]
MADIEKNTEVTPEKNDAAKKPEKKKKDKVKLSERLKKFWRDYKSELKKIVWCPWKQVKNNTVVVVVIVALTGALIGVLDFGFSQAITWLGDLF